MNQIEKDFAYFCRRVCMQCNGDTRSCLSTCPIIKFDAWRYLKINHENGMNGHPAKCLKSEIEVTVTTELVKAVGNHAGRTFRSNSQVKQKTSTD